MGVDGSLSIADVSWMRRDPPAPATRTPDPILDASSIVLRSPNIFLAAPRRCSAAIAPRSSAGRRAMFFLA
eukprot:358484-Pyramimonas_sp.AAC.1